MKHSIQLKSLYRPSNQPIHAQPSLIALALVKNEASIISNWLAHVLELFDLVYIVDHKSTDGTCEYLIEVAKSEGKIHLFSFEHPGYFQSEIINHLAQSVIQHHPNAWLFPLDADEFLNVASRDEFISLVGQQKQENILRLNWQNCLPMFMARDQLLEPNFPCIFPSHRGIYNKVAANAKTLKDGNLSFTQGNHGLEDDGQLIQKNIVDFIDLYHLPIRSIDHFALKCIQGYIAKISLPPDRDHRGQLVHWKNMIDTVLNSGTFDANLLRKFVASYGQPNDVEFTNLYDLLDKGWEVDGFSVATHENIRKHLVNRKYSYIDLAYQALQGYGPDPELRGFLRIINESRERISDLSTWQQEMNGNQIYKKLPDIQHSYNSEQLTDSSDIELLSAFFSKAYTTRQNPVPSTWEGHVPFLYCLLDWARPRRFVELGSQYGNCFFAACQTSQILDNLIECIAVDMWIGDEHTGAYRDEVFKFFLHFLNSYYPRGKYIRNFFSEAVSQFEDGSIDLLHIDGLHTYEAVVEDYQTWLPKLSDQGIIMFHDTQERDRNFGVWKLWAEIKGKYPSFEFEHGHGLGVILVGAKASRAVQALFHVLSKPENLSFSKFFFSNIKPVLPG